MGGAGRNQESFNPVVEYIQAVLACLSQAVRAREEERREGEEEVEVSFQDFAV